MVNAMPHPLSYAAVDVATHQRRTIGSTVFRWMKFTIIAGARVIRQLIVVLAVTMIVAGHLLRLAFHLIGAALLLFAGIRWSEVRRRLMRGALWVDRAVLRIVGVFSRPLARTAVH